MPTGLPCRAKEGARAEDGVTFQVKSLGKSVDARVRARPAYDSREVHHDERVRMTSKPINADEFIVLLRQFIKND